MIYVNEIFAAFAGQLSGSSNRATKPKPQNIVTDILRTV